MGFEGGVDGDDRAVVIAGLCSLLLSPSLLVSGQSILPCRGAEPVLCRGREGQG